VKAAGKPEELGRRPSTDPSTLMRQLDRELDKLSQREAADTENLYRAYLDAAFAQLWDAIATGAFGEIRGWVDRLAGLVTAFIDRNRGTGAPATLAAIVELRQALRLLEHADESLTRRGLEQELADSTRTPAAREVIRVLASEPDEYLKRGDIHSRMRLPDGVITAARVSQILAEFDDEGLLQRTHARVQGHEAAAHYKLSPAGRDLCSRLGLGAFDGACFDLRDAAAHAARRGGPHAELVSGSHPEEPTDELIDRTITFCGWRGTSVLPEIARLLTEGAPEDSRYSVILIDFDLDAPRLDGAFAWEGLAECGGLAHLCLDYHAVSPPRRAEWLSSELTSPRYTVKCADADFRKLCYLPTGRAAAASSAVRWSEVHDLLRSNIRAQPRKNGQPSLASLGFLCDLRRALHTRFRATLIEAPPGLGELTYAATLLLASDLVKPAAIDDDAMCDMLEVVESHFRWREGLHVEDPAARIMTVADPRAVDFARHVVEPTIPASGISYRVAETTFSPRDVAYRIAAQTVTPRTRQALTEASNIELSRVDRMLYLNQVSWQAPRIIVSEIRRLVQLSDRSSDFLDRLIEVTAGEREPRYSRGDNRIRRRNEPTPRKRILIIDDAVEHIDQLSEVIWGYGGEPVVANNAAAGRCRLAAIAGGEERYALATIDVMMALKSLDDVTELEHAVNEDAKRIGVALCREARQQHHIRQEMLDIVCYSMRDDTDIIDELKELEIPYIPKVTSTGWSDLRHRVERALAAWH